MSRLAAQVGHQRLLQLQQARENPHWIRGFVDRELEAAYAHWLRLERARARIALMIVPLVALLLAPWYGELLLDSGGMVNPERVFWLRAVELGLCIPACLWAITALNYRPESHNTTRVFLFAGASVFFGLAMVRWITALDGGSLPVELVMLAPLTVASIGGLRNYLMLPMIWFCTVFLVSAEFALHEGPVLSRALLGIVVMASIATMNAIVVNRLSRRAWLERGIAELTGMVDGVTGLPNRAWFNRDAAVLMAQLHRQPVPVTVLLLDLDYFKKLNDNHGHADGDAALNAVGKLLLEQVARRPLDLCARYGGEEFVVVLYDTAQSHALQVAARLVADVFALRIANKGAPQGRLSTSIGIWQGIPARSDRIEDLLSRADQALYLAKSAGRNQYQLWKPAVVPVSG